MIVPGPHVRQDRSGECLNTPGASIFPPTTLQYSVHVGPFVDMAARDTTAVAMVLLLLMIESYIDVFKSIDRGPTLSESGGMYHEQTPLLSSPIYILVLLYL